MRAIPIDEITALFLEQVTEDPSLIETSQIAATLNQYGLISKTPVSSEPVKTKEVPVVNIALFISQRCNLNCIYCYGEGGSYHNESEMDRETAFRAVDWLIAQAININVLSISFFGGEPLLNFDLLKEVVLYAKSQGLVHNKTFNFKITTNATLLDEKKVAFLKEHNITPCVSFDGPEEIQDRQRPQKNGKGSYKSTIPNILRLLQEIPESSCRATIMNNTDPVIVKQALNELGFQKIRLTAVTPKLSEKVTNTMTPERTATSMMVKDDIDAEQLLQCLNTHDLAQLKVLKDSSILFTYIALFISNLKKNFFCGAGRHYAAVSTAGDMYLCHRFVGQEQYLIGNIGDCQLERASYLQCQSFKNNKCQFCFAKFTCAGYCYFDNFAKTGSIYEASEDTCQRMRHLTELAGFISSRLTKEDCDYLIKEGLIPKKTCILDFFSEE